MKMFKAVLAGLAVVFLVTGVQAAVRDRIVAVVNDQVITLSELNEAFEPFQARLAGAYSGPDRERAIAEHRAMLLNRLVDKLLMEQEAGKAGITVREEDVSDAIREILERRKISQEELLRTLRREGTNLAAYRKGIREQLMRIRLIRRELQAKVAVTDEEIGAYYLKHRADYEGAEAVRLRQIVLLLPRGGEPAAKARLRANAEEVHRRLLAGQPFEQLSAQYSQGPGAETGGDVGFVERGVILSEVEEVAFGLPVGQISGVIESSVGFHIVQVVDRRGAGLKSIEAVREEIREKIDQEKMEKKFEEWLAELRKKSHIEIKL
jgi:parvulin-like peptidyl-prolyl isomerase